MSLPDQTARTAVCANMRNVTQAYTGTGPECNFTISPTYALHFAHYNLIWSAGRHGHAHLL